MEATECPVDVAAGAAVAEVYGEGQGRRRDRDDEVHRLAVALGCQRLVGPCQLVREVEVCRHFDSIEGCSRC